MDNNNDDKKDLYNSEYKYGKMKDEQNNNGMNVQPGYTKFVIDEQKADYDYIKGKFTDEEIKEAFQALDINKTKHITAENLTFFLEYLNEKATEEEIEEMIKMCDLDGNGEVSYDEFHKLATGQSLAPIGQAYAPTAEMKAKREKLEQLMKDDSDSFYNNQVQNNKKKGKQIKIDQTQHINDLNQSSYQQQLHNQQKSINQSNFLMQNQSQAMINMGQNYQLQSTVNKSKINSFYFGQTGTSEQAENQQKLHDYLGSLKQIIQQRQKLFKKFVKEKKYNGIKVQALTQKYLKQQLPQEIKSYEQFFQVLGESQDTKVLDELYNNLTDVVIAGDDQNQTPILYTQDLILMLLGVSSDIKTLEKYQIAFDIVGQEKITKEHVFHMVLVMTFKAGIDHIKLGQKIKQKYSQGNYKKTLNQDEIDKTFFEDIVNSYPTYFY